MFRLNREGYALNTSITKNSDAWNKWIFGYTYDAVGRIIEKHTPGGGWEYTVFNRNDLPVLTQDASQTAINKWSFSKYDQFGRTTIQGELDNASSRATLQTSFDGIAISHETWVSPAGYTNNSYPISYSATAERTWNYYDTYEWIAGEWAFNAGTAFNSGNHYSNARCLMTGTAARNPEDPNKWLHDVTYYDNKSRPMQSFRVHDKGGASPWAKPVITNIGYNFAGDVLNKKVLYQVDGLANTETFTTNDFDNTGRSIKVYHGINTTATEISRADYDEAGRLKQSKIRATGSYTANGTSISGLQTVDYSYNLRGQLRGINLDGSGNPVPNSAQGDLFSYKLDYETAGIYNGNIGKQYWQASANNTPAGLRTYTFMYDAASRLRSAAYSGIGTEKYNMPTINYDRNGNLINLTRYGKLTSTFGPMDSLSYNYIGNRLMRVEDQISGDYIVDFVNRNSLTDDYSYTANGSLKSDKNEAINDIIYNTFANQPSELQLTSSRWIKNFYDGVGRLYKTSYSTGEYWEYLDGMIFKNGAFSQLATPEGRATYQSGAWSYEYFHTDHLGNTRVAYKANGTTLVKTSETSFDPWGVVLRDAGLENALQNKFEYQNKEKESTFNLRRLDFGARSYNASIGRFDRVDRLSHRYLNLSTFQYSADNPVNIIDVNGDSLVISFNMNGVVYKVFYGFTEKDGYGFYNSDGSAYKRGTNDFVDKTESNLARLGLGKEGRQMIDFLASNSQSVSISEVVTDQTKGTGNGYFSTSNSVGFDPNQNTNIPTEKGGWSGFTKAPTYISLGHELAHAEDDLKGTLNESATWIGTVRNYAEAEKYSTHRENQFRAENGLPLRTHYGIITDNQTGIQKGDYLTRIIDSMGNSLFFKPYNYRSKR